MSSQRTGIIYPCCAEPENWHYLLMTILISQGGWQYLPMTIPTSQRTGNTYHTTTPTSNNHMRNRSDLAGLVGWVRDELVVGHLEKMPITLIRPAWCNPTYTSTPWYTKWLPAPMLGTL